MTTVQAGLRGSGPQIPTRASSADPPRVHLRINGEKVMPASGESRDHVNPVTGEVDAVIRLADTGAVDDAVRFRPRGVRRLATHETSAVPGDLAEPG